MGMLFAEYISFVVPRRLQRPKQVSYSQMKVKTCLHGVTYILPADVAAKLLPQRAHGNLYLPTASDSFAKVA